MIKQVIVVRHDLHMRAGKQIVQGSHASSVFLLEKLENGLVLNSVEQEWANSGMTKICVRVDSEEELLSISEKAIEAGLTMNLIIDLGKTEFDGVPTKTCLAIGPAKAEIIDTITGHLKLL